MKEILSTLLTDEVRRCELCGSNSWRILHEGDESNCECEGECLRVCDNPDLSDEGCDGVAELVNQDQGECDKCDAFYDLGSQDNRCGNCGNCGNCCTHNKDEKVCDNCPSGDPAIYEVMTLSGELALCESCHNN